LFIKKKNLFSCFWKESCGWRSSWSCQRRPWGWKYFGIKGIIATYANTQSIS
jgi:hypothetical protein